MPIDFPSSPSVGQQYTYAGITYTYTAQGVWSAASSAAVPVNTLGGRLTYVSATALLFAPYNGNQIKINGSLQTIPTSGIVGLTNTAAFVNGTGGSSLAASTTYYVYAFMNSSTVTADFSATGHATSTTAGNEGVEIKNGDDTRTLIGMIRTNASSQFQDVPGARFVISWLNRRNISLLGATSAGGNTTSSSYLEIASGARAFFLTWAEEAIFASCTGYIIVTPSPNWGAIDIGLDGATSQSNQPPFSVSYATYESMATSVVFKTTEGYHYLSPTASVQSGGTLTGWLMVAGLIKG